MSEGAGNHLIDAVLSCGLDSAAFLVRADGRRLAYAALRERVAGMASALAAAGVRPGDRVAAQIAKSPEGLILYLGAVRAGAVFLPLNTAYTLSEVAAFLADAEPAMLVCDPAVRDNYAALASGPLADLRIETLDAAGQGSLGVLAEAADGSLPPAERGPGDLAAILYTSGTTGRSKGAMLTHGNLVSNARTLVALWRFTPADRLLHALPIYHLHGLFTAVNTVLAAGASLLFLPKFEVGEVIRQMPQASVLMGVPTFYTRLLENPGLSEASAGMRLFISGSAPLLAETHRRFAERTGHAILERYGMTETSMIASNPIDGERRPGSVGFPLPEVSVRVVAPEGGGADGDVGTIEVKGSNVCAGYWRNPEKTAAEFRPDGYFITGDLGRFDADGYLHISGRGKDLIIVGGLNVYPREVELVLDTLPGVGESAVIGVPHPDLGEGVTAVVVAAAGAELDERRLLDAFAGRLARFKQPRRVIFAAELPRNAMGKVQKNVLRASLADLYGAG